MTGIIQPSLAFARGSVLDANVDARRPLGRSTPSAEAPRGPRWRVVAAATIALGLAATAYVMASDESDPQPVEAPVVAPLIEAPVDAADLPAGSMYHVVDQIGARSLWDAGITGAGINVAVIDTGVAPVDGLADDGKVVAAIDLSSEASDSRTAYVDTNGHGTHMAGIIAGRESGAQPALAAQHPEWFLGVAPDAGIVSVKVGNREGDVAPGGLVAAVNWVVDHADEHDIRVINLSVGSQSGLPATQDPLIAAVQRAWDAGIVVVTAAGNLGADSNGLLSPASDPFVIAVAGADVSDTGIRAADWTSAGDGVRNPDVAAPGAHLQSLRAPGSDADVNHPEGFVDDETFQGSGSSQAAAVVAGAAALLLEQRPELTNDQVKALLVDAAQP
ncbi:MAG: S8 family serine peptidase, partial [Ilumatobacteraceae bacterium]